MTTATSATRSKTDRRGAETEDRYPSRQGGHARMIPRRDPVVWGTNEGVPAGPLAAQQLESYAVDGFLNLESLLGEGELGRARQHLERLRAERQGKSEDGVITEPGSEEVRSIFRVHALGGPLAELTRHPELVAIARQLLGGDVYIHQSRVNVKPAFRGKEFYWHSDFETWHVEDGMPAMRAVSMSISLTDNSVHNGPLLLIPRSHQRFVACPGKTPEGNFRESLKKQVYGTPDDASLSALVEEGGLVGAAGPAGSVSIFECNTMHGSNGNITPWPRSNVFVVFNSVENRLVAPFSGLEPRPDFLATREDVPAL